MTSSEMITHETLEHILKVSNNINKIIKQLIDRIEKHDKSRLQQEELKEYSDLLIKLKTSDITSEAYQKLLVDYNYIIKLHEKRNRHHPEFHYKGIAGMNLIDILEMLADWVAVHPKQTLWKELPVLKEKYQLDDQLFSIIKNTLLDMI